MKTYVVVEVWTRTHVIEAADKTDALNRAQEPDWEETGIELVRPPMVRSAVVHEVQS